MTKLSWAMGLSLFAVALPAIAEDAVALKYRFSAGQVLRYQGKQNTTIESTVSGTTQKFTSETNSLREWRVIGVDEKGNARLSMTIVRVHVEAKGPDGKKLSFDTEKDGEQSPLAVVVGTPLVEVILSPTGQVVEIVESKSAAAGPFVAHVRTLLFPMPPKDVAPGTRWQHDLTLPVPAPMGKFDQVRVRQTFGLEKVANSVATINLESAPAEEIKDRALMGRIAQFLPSGRVELDLSRGVLRSLELTLDQKVSDFAGKDSVMQVTGSYSEVLKDDVAGVSTGRQ